MLVLETNYRPFDLIESFTIATAVMHGCPICRNIRDIPTVTTTLRHQLLILVINSIIQIFGYLIMWCTFRWFLP